VPTSADRGVSRGQRGGSPTAVNLSFLDLRQSKAEDKKENSIPLEATQVQKDQKAYISDNGTLDIRLCVS
jgi:hypothetical protein